MKFNLKFIFCFLLFSKVFAEIEFNRELIEKNKLVVKNEILLNKIAKYSAAGSTISVAFYLMYQSRNQVTLNKLDFNSLQECIHEIKALRDDLKKQLPDVKIPQPEKRYLSPEIKNLFLSNFIYLIGSELLSKLKELFEPRDLNWFVKKTQLFEVIEAIKKQNNFLLQSNNIAEQEVILHYYSLLIEKLILSTAKIIAFLEYQTENDNIENPNYKLIAQNLFNLFSGQEGYLIKIIFALNNFNKNQKESLTQMSNILFSISNSFDILKRVQD